MKVMHSMSSSVHNSIPNFSIPSQIERFVEVAQMTAADVAERVEICRNVEATLAKAQFAVPGSVSVYPFGSSVNGLGFR